MYVQLLRIIHQGTSCVVWLCWQQNWQEIEGPKVPMGTNFWQLVCRTSEHAQGLTMEFEMRFGYASEKCMQKVHTHAIPARPPPNYRLHARIACIRSAVYFRFTRAIFGKRCFFLTKKVYLPHKAHKREKLHSYKEQQFIDGPIR